MFAFQISEKMQFLMIFKNTFTPTF